MISNLSFSFIIIIILYTVRYSCFGHLSPLFDGFQKARNKENLNNQIKQS